MRNIVKQLERLFIPSQRNQWKPQILRPRNLFKLAVILLIVKFFVFSWLYYFPQSTHFADITSSQLVEMVNKDRVTNGLKPLVVNQQLVEAAQKKALDMLNQDYFAHTSPSGITPWFWLSKVGYKYTAAGENLAKDFSESEYVHEAWMDSSSHRANILNGNYQEIGIAVVEGEMNGQKTTVAVQFFGKSSVKAKQVAVANIDKTQNKIETPAPEPETSPIVKGEEVKTLKGPEVFQQRGISIKEIVQAPKTLIGVLSDKLEPFAQKTYIIILSIISLVLMLSIFINIRIQYPKMILMVVIFLILVAAVTMFNGSALINKGIDII